MLNHLHTVTCLLKRTVRTWIQTCLTSQFVLLINHCAQLQLDWVIPARLQGYQSQMDMRNLAKDWSSNQRGNGDGPSQLKGKTSGLEIAQCQGSESQGTNTQQETRASTQFFWEMTYTSHCPEPVYVLPSLFWDGQRICCLGKHSPYDD